MAIPESVKRQSTNAVHGLGNLLWDLAGDIATDVGNSYRAVHMQHTGWITAGRYHYTDPEHEQREREREAELARRPMPPQPEVNLNLE